MGGRWLISQERLAYQGCRWWSGNWTLFALWTSASSGRDHCACPGRARVEAAPRAVVSTGR